MPNSPRAIPHQRQNAQLHVDQGDRVARGLLLCCLALYSVHAVYATATHRHLYGDASWFLVRIISDGIVTNFFNNFLTEFYYSRFVSYALTQLPTVVVARLGVGDWQVLSWVMGATYFLHKPLSLFACYLLLPRGSKLAIIFPLLAVFAGTINSEIYIVTETHIAISLYWPLLVAISLWQRPGTRFFVACAIAFLLLTFSYESMAVLGAALWAVVFIRWLQADQGRKAGWAWLLLAALVPITINWMAILLPRDPTNKAAFMDGMLMLWQQSTASLSSMHASAVASLLALFAVGTILHLRGVGLRFPGWSMFALIASVLAAFPLLHYVSYSGQVDFSHSITDRGFGGLVIQVLLVPVFLLNVVSGFRHLRQDVFSIAAIVAALATGQIAWQLMATRSWDHALATASVALEERKGQVACSADSLPQSPGAYGIAPASAILCHWWLMPLSVLLAPAGEVRSIFYSTETFRPFDPLASGSLPSMKYAPVDYRPLLAEIQHSLAVHSGEIVNFTKGSRGLELIRSGFSHPEVWATWTDGPQAVLAFCAIGEGRLKALFTLVPFVNQARPTLDAEVFLNGERADSWHFVAGEKQVERSVVVVGAAEGSPGGCTQMLVKFSNASPAPGDSRRLGVAFVKLVILEANN